MAKLLSGTRVYGNTTIDTYLVVSGANVSNSKTTGAITVAGGVGVGGNVYADKIYESSVSGTTRLFDSANTVMNSLISANTAQLRSEITANAVSANSVINTNISQTLSSLRSEIRSNAISANAYSDSNVTANVNQLRSEITANAHSSNVIIDTNISSNVAQLRYEITSNVITINTSISGNVATLNTFAQAAFDAANAVTAGGVASITPNSYSRLTVSSTSGYIGIDLASVPTVTAGSYTYPSMQVDAYGRVITISNQTPVTSITSNGQLTFSQANGTVYAGLANVSSSIGIYGGGNNITVITTDGFGRVTSAANTTPYVEWTNINNMTGSSGPQAIAIGQNRVAGTYAVSIGPTSTLQSGQGQSAVAVGRWAGLTNQGTYSVGVGQQAGYSNQGGYSVAVGYGAGATNQGLHSVAIGELAGNGAQGNFTIAIGHEAGYVGQNANSIVIGTKAGRSNVISGSITLNASGQDFSPLTDGFFVSNVRTETSTSDLAFYNTTNKEFTHNSNITYNGSTNSLNLASGMLRLKGGSTPYSEIYSSSGGSLYLSADAGNSGNNNILFSINASERMRINSAGNLGLGVTPSAWGTGSAYRAIDIGLGSSLANMASTTTTDLISNAYYNGTNWIYKNTAAASKYRQSAGAHTWSIATSGTAAATATFTDAMTLDASGRLLIGATSSRAFGGFGQGSLQVETAVGSALETLISNRNDTGASVLGFGKSRGTTTGSATAVTSGDPLGTLNWSGADGTSLVSSSSIFGAVDDAVSTGIVPGRLVFSTSNTSGTLTERMRIDSNGNLGVGITPSAWRSDLVTKALQLNTASFASFNGDSLYVGQNVYLSSGGWKYVSTGTTSLYIQNGGEHSWYTASSGSADASVTFTQEMTLDSIGRLMIGPPSVSTITGTYTQFEIMAPASYLPARMTLGTTNYNGSVSVNNNIGGLSFETGGQEYVRITPNGGLQFNQSLDSGTSPANGVLDFLMSNGDAPPSWSDRASASIALALYNFAR